MSFPGDKEFKDAFARDDTNAGLAARHALLVVVHRPDKVEIAEGFLVPVKDDPVDDELGSNRIIRLSSQGRGREIVGKCSRAPGDVEQTTLVPGFPVRLDGGHCAKCPGNCAQPNGRPDATRRS